MQIAQKLVEMGQGRIKGVRGVLSEANVEDYSAAVSGGWDAEFIQMTGGPLAAKIDYLVGSDFTLYRESWQQRLHSEGCLHPGLMAIGIPSRRVPDSRWWGGAVPLGMIPYGNSSRQLNLLTEPGETLMVLSAKESDFRRLFEALSGHQLADLLYHERYLCGTPESVEALRLSWSQVLENSSSLSRRHLGLADLVAMIVDAIAVPEGREDGFPATKAGVFERAMHLAKQMNYEISIAELSGRLGMGRRTIENAFRECLNLSPHCYFTLRRLNACRDELSRAKEGETSVTAVASRHGFRELGRFAGLYRSVFGESPSETLRKNETRVRFRRQVFG